MEGCDEQNNQVNLMAHIWKYAHLYNITCWKPVEHGWKCFPLLCEDDGSPNDDNDTDDGCMTPSKDESE